MKIAPESFLSAVSGHCHHRIFTGVHPPETTADDEENDGKRGFSEMSGGAMMCGPTTLVESIRSGEKSWFLSVSLSLSLSFRLSGSANHQLALRSLVLVYLVVSPRPVRRMPCARATACVSNASSLPLLSRVTVESISLSLSLSLRGPATLTPIHGVGSTESN